jgi:hypothetical protein
MTASDTKPLGNAKCKQASTRSEKQNKLSCELTEMLNNRKLPLRLFGDFILSEQSPGFGLRANWVFRDSVSRVILTSWTPAVNLET